MTTANLRNALGLALALILATGIAHAAGFNYTTDGTNPMPITWDTSNGPIPIYTDGGEAFTFEYDGVTPFITIERANQITAFAYGQWNNIPTATFNAQIAGTIESQTGIADVTGANATEIYDVENGYGIWVLYDTDGSILEDYFGAPRTAVLGIAFPEWSDGNGTIIEATAVLNGWFVYDDDVDGNQMAGVFTHEFGHTLNLSHTQVNGHMAYYGYTYAPLYPGVEGCGVEPVYRYDYPSSYGLNTADPWQIETMYPFIDHGGEAGEAMSYVTMPDDIAALSNLYPTAEYFATTGSIAGTLYLKDGKTQFSGINVIARNVNDPMGDAISAMTGDQTQGKVGPDGSFVIHGLTAGEQYVLYTEQIVAGGFPTTPQRLISVAEYWNDAESNDPILDDPCEATPIVAEAGVTTTTDLVFNGYVKGVDFTPIAEAFLTDLAKNGKISAGFVGSTAFLWSEVQGFTVLPPEIKGINGSLNRNGTKMLVGTDLDGNGVGAAAIWSPNGTVVSLGDLNGDTCGGSSSAGSFSSYPWALDDKGDTAVGTAYIDVDGNGSCQTTSLGEIVPFVWTKKRGMRQLATDGAPSPTSWIRAHAISGNGKVILGNNGGSRAVAWVNEGELIDLYGMVGAQDAYAASYDGTKVALQTRSNGVILWNPTVDGPEAFEGIGGLRWCYDMPYMDFFGRNYCDFYDWDYINDVLGPIPVLPTDMTDNGSIIIGRAGSFFTGFAGAFWSEATGWMTWEDFFAKQGVVEAANVPFDNPISMSASGSEVVGGIAGATFSWHVNIDQVYVCHEGESIQTGFPNGMFDMLAQGAEFGRCEHLVD